MGLRKRIVMALSKSIVMALGKKVVMALRKKVLVELKRGYKARSHAERASSVQCSTTPGNGLLQCRGMKSLQYRALDDHQGS